MLHIKEQYGLEADHIDTMKSHIAITTNGTFYKVKNRAYPAIVTGAGIAQWATEKWPEFPMLVGEWLYVNQNNVPVNLNIHGDKVISFPVKHNWWEKANMMIIAQSMLFILRHWTFWEIERLYIPFPGCGMGQLEWKGSTGVKDVLDSFTRPAVNSSCHGELVFFTREEAGK